MGRVLYTLLHIARLHSDPLTLCGCPLLTRHYQDFWRRLFLGPQANSRLAHLSALWLLPSYNLVDSWESPWCQVSPWNAPLLDIFFITLPLCPTLNLPNLIPQPPRDRNRIGVDGRGRREAVRRDERRGGKRNCGQDIKWVKILIKKRKTNDILKITTNKKKWLWESILPQLKWLRPGKQMAISSGNTVSKIISYSLVESKLVWLNSTPPGHRPKGLC